MFKKGLENLTLIILSIIISLIVIELAIRIYAKYYPTKQLNGVNTLNLPKNQGQSKRTICTAIQPQKECRCRW